MQLSPKLLELECDYREVSSAEGHAAASGQHRRTCHHEEVSVDSLPTRSHFHTDGFFR